MPFVPRVSWRLARAASVAGAVMAAAMCPAAAAMAIDGRSGTVPIEVDLVGEAIAGMSTFVGARLDTDDAHTDGDAVAVTLEECPILSHDDLAGLVEAPAEPDDYRLFAAFSTSSTSAGGDFMTLDCQSSIVRRDGNKLIDSAMFRVLLYPEAPSLDEVIATSGRGARVQRLDGIGTIGYCEDLPESGHACSQAWQSGRLVVTLSRTSHGADVAFDASSTGETLMGLVPTMLYDLAGLANASDPTGG